MNESPVRMIEAPPPQLFPIIGEEGTGGAQHSMYGGADNFLLLFGGTEVGGL